MIDVWDGLGGRLWNCIGGVFDLHGVYIRAGSSDGGVFMMTKDEYFRIKMALA